VVLQVWGQERSMCIVWRYKHTASSW
jgi:hypothetical protein